MPTRIPTLPSYTRARIRPSHHTKKQYHPARMILTVLGINLIPLTVLLFCVALIGDYRERLIKMELELLHAQSKTYAKTIETIEDTKQETLVEKLNIAPNHQMILFGKDTEIIIQADNILEHKGAQEKSVMGAISNNVISALMILTKVSYNAPLFPQVDIKDHSSFPGLENGLLGLNNIAAWTTESDKLILSSTIPVFKEDELYGALFILHSAEGLTKSISDIQEDIFRIFISIFALSIAFSLYIVGTITHPLRKLAKAAENIRSESFLGTQEIPDMSDRGDEIGELSRAFTAMVETLWDRMFAIESFAADVSHELKNPITSIKSALETLPKVKKQADKDTLIKIIEHDINRLDRLITDISKSTRLDAELSTGETRNIAIDDFLHDIRDIYRKRYEYAKDNINIGVINNTKSQVSIYGYQEKLTQVFLNIIDNALSLSADENNISIIIDEQKTTVKIRINDSGPGIPEANLDKIFERFYSDRPKKEGMEHHSGLGLSIVKQIIKAHDGTIIAQNQKDAHDNILGASFIITLPISTKEET